MLHRKVRKGATYMQWVVIAALISLAVIGSVTVIGTRTRTKLNETATDVANPAALTTRFGS